jgi:hypothetical protein
MYALIVNDSTGIAHRMDARQELTKETLVSELLSFEGVGGTITAIEPYDPEADVEIEGASFIAGTPGLYRLRVTATNGVRQLLIRVVDPSVLAAIPDPGFVVGQGQSAAPRMVLRSICNHCPEWDGTAAMFYDRIKLADHGVCFVHR